MTDTMYASLTIDQALERLTFPSFFSDAERKEAYQMIMTSGTEEQKHRIDDGYFLDQSDRGQTDLFDSTTEISIAIDDQLIRIGE